MVTWPDIARQITMSLPDCPEPTLWNGIRRACTDFLRDTRALRVRDVVLVSATEAGRSVYSLPALNGFAAVDILAAWAGGVPLRTTEWGEHIGVAPNVRANSVGDWSIGIDSPSTLRMSPPPEVAALQVVGVVQYITDLDSVGVPDLIWHRWCDTLRAGAVAELAEQVGKAWSNPALAQRKRAQYEIGRHQAANQQGPARRRSPMRVRGASFSDRPMDAEYIYRGPIYAEQLGPGWDDALTWNDLATWTE